MSDTTPLLDQVAVAAGAVADATRTYLREPNDVTWFAYRTAVERVSERMLALVADTPVTPSSDAMRSAAAQASEAAAIMRNANGRLSPGAELAVVVKLEAAAEQWAIARGLLSAPLHEGGQVLQSERVCATNKQDARKQRRRRRTGR